mmetsp:Transcript_39937/g.125449  ORF Transcript_39937/g.125449 Transcript_39937/m.125449 type:complete len:89 (-) Transcript_39937:880-1146(-)
MQNLSQSSNNKMQAIIRTYPGRVLKITVLSQYKRPLSFDACSPPSPCGKRRSVSDDQVKTRCGLLFRCLFTKPCHLTCLVDTIPSLGS